MQADFAVELGRDDEVLEFPWAADGGPRYFDLKRHPELLPNIDEASRVPELGEFLTAINSLPLLETAKCDIWPSTDINPEEEIFGATHKFGSYIDLVFSSDSARFSFPEHEQFVKHLTQLLAQVPEIPASAEFMIPARITLKQKLATASTSRFIYLGTATKNRNRGSSGPSL